jgi:hypothetical protein
MAQCELFKSEIKGVKNNVTLVSQLVDSLQTYAESGAFAAQITSARANAKKVELLTGLALNASDEAVAMASEAQYYSEVCNIAEVKSYTIDAESYAIDARDFADEAFTNAKKANTAKNLGDVRYYMRKSLNASREAKKSADDAAYAASIARMSCTHNDAHGIGSDD